MILDNLSTQTAGGLPLPFAIRWRTSEFVALPAQARVSLFSVCCSLTISTHHSAMSSAPVPNAADSLQAAASSLQPAASGLAQLTTERAAVIEAVAAGATYRVTSIDGPWELTASPYLEASGFTASTADNG